MKIKLKNIIFNTFLVLVSTYIPLLFTSFFIKITQFNEDINQKIKAVKSGYFPVYYPSLSFGGKKELNIYPIGSLPLKNSYLCDEGYGLITYKTDRFGLRNPDKNWNNIYKKNNIFIVGDSFIHGACVPKDGTISNNLQRITGINTLAIGMGGNNPYEYIASLKSMVSPIIKKSSESNIVILSFYSNDIRANINLKKESLINSMKPIINYSGDNIYPSQFYINNLTSFIESLYPQSPEEIIKEIKNKTKKPFKKTNFYTIATLYPLRVKFGLAERLYSKSKIFSNLVSRKSIIALSEICRNQCKPMVLYIPNSKILRPDKRSEKYKNDLKDISFEMGIPFVDANEVIDSSKLKDYAPKGAHLSIKGYKKVAELISKEIMK